MLYELPGDPLGDSADPRRYVPLDRHEHALEALTAGLRERASPILLVGAGGVGKTLLLRVLAQRERRAGHLAVFSPFLHLPPDDVAPWLLYLLGRPAPAAAGPDAALLAALNLYPAAPMVVIVDEIQSAPAASVRRLIELLQAGGTGLSLVAAGAPGSRLEALLPVLAPKATLELPEALRPEELDALCNAILRHPALELELRTLSLRERQALLRAAQGNPVLLKNALVRRALGASVEARRTALAPGAEIPRAAEAPRESGAPWPAWPSAPDEDVRPKHEPRPGLAPWPRRRPAARSDPLRGLAAPSSLAAPATPADDETVRALPLGRAALPRVRRAARVAGAIVSRELERSATAGEKLARALVRACRRQTARLPRPPLAATAALLLLALVPLGDASRVELAAAGRAARPASVSSRPPPAVALPPVRVQVNARPWAQVRVDGIDVGPTPLSHLQLAPGLHDFEARFPDGRVLQRRIEIGPSHRFVSLP